MWHRATQIISRGPLYPINAQGSSPLPRLTSHSPDSGSRRVNLSECWLQLVIMYALAKQVVTGNVKVDQ